jgi:hypothetical protein
MPEPAPDALSFVTTFVWSGMEPVRLVVHERDGTWQFSCNTTTDVAFILTVHADHVFERFADDLAGLSDLPCGFLAWRDYNSEPWTVEPDPNTYD